MKRKYPLCFMVWKLALDKGSTYQLFRLSDAPEREDCKVLGIRRAIFIEEKEELGWYIFEDEKEHIIIDHYGLIDHYDFSEWWEIRLCS